MPPKRTKSAAAAPAAKAPVKGKRKTPEKNEETSEPAPAVSAPKPAVEFPGIVMSMGQGDISQLGHGSDEAFRLRKFATIVKTLTKLNITTIAAGSLHNAVLDDAGIVHTWGCNDDGALGRPGDEWFPELVALPGKVTQVRCGSSHTIALTEEGEAFVWGTYRDAQGVMGMSEGVEIANTPLLIDHLKGKKVVRVAAGSNHDLALTSNGEVWQWGDIGIGMRSSARKKTTRLEPRRVTFKHKGRGFKIVNVFAGGYSSFALDNTGKLWVWGPNNYHQCGVINPADTKAAEAAAAAASADSDDEAGKGKTPDASNLADYAVLLPTVIEGIEGEIVRVAADVHHSLVLTADGTVYSFGRGEAGRLGHGDENDCHSPKAIATFKSLPDGDRIVSVGCGEAVSLAVTANGFLYSWGYGDLLQLGNGKEEDVSTPTKVTSGMLTNIPRHVIQAEAGSQHTLLLARDTPASVKLLAEQAAAKSAGASSSSSSSSSAPAAAAPAAPAAASPTPASPAPAPASAPSTDDSSAPAPKKQKKGAKATAAKGKAASPVKAAASAKASSPSTEAVKETESSSADAVVSSTEPLVSSETADKLWDTADIALPPDEQDGQDGAW